MRLPAPRLLLVTDRHQARVPLSDLLAAAFEAGCRWASLREKDLPPDEQVALARRLVALARRHGARLTLHGDPAIAHAAGADGVHLVAGADAAAARRLLGADALVGISIHGAGEAACLDPGAVDYAVAGPAYASASKPGYGPAVGLAGMGAIVAASRVPIVAIGGVDAAVVGELRAAGAAGIAVMGGVMRAPRPDDAVRDLLAALAAADRAQAGQPRPR